MFTVIQAERKNALKIYSVQAALEFYYLNEFCTWLTFFYFKVLKINNKYF